jgi:esterase/lipase superfamily enzyme
MPHTVAKMASSWLVRAGIPTLAVAGVATIYSSVSNDLNAPNKSAPQQVSEPISSGSVSPQSPTSQQQRMSTQIAENGSVSSQELMAKAHSDEPKVEPKSAIDSAVTGDSSVNTGPENEVQPGVTLLPSGAKLVRIFYATDRDAADLRSQIPWVSGVIPLCLAILATFGIIGLAPSMLKRYWPVVAFGGVLVISFLGHSVWIRTSALLRMSSKYGVVFGTNRYQSPESSYPLHLGYADITIPPNHQRGKLETPEWTKLEWKEDEKKHVILQSIKPEREADYFNDLAGRLRSSDKPEILVFIHGYNVSFADAARRTAQLHHDLKFPGAPICYSWPSSGLISGYTRDEAAVGWTVAHLEKFLNDLHKRTEVSKIHLIAHSMGNRALVGALERLVLRDPSASAWLGQIVLAAPDVDSGELANRFMPTIVSNVERVTLYTSRNDKALLASAALHGADRAGYRQASQLIFKGVETIDVSSIDTGLLGHSYYGEHPDLIKDLQALVELNRPAKLRDWLQPVSVRENQAYWVFEPKRVATQIQERQPSSR